MTDFQNYFETLGNCGRAHDWQGELAGNPLCGNRLIRIPTGFGKTLGVLAAWSWNRLAREDDTWPRRLVWCLPMRVLVEQTTEEVERALRALGLLWEGGKHAGKVGVHVLMGGVDGGDWHLYPEECAVLIGTQDMLLSRALNRGYGTRGRARWPMEFGLLNQDSLWVMDEVQLMDVGLATSAQLQAFRHDDREKSQRPSFTWWMSATLQAGWLEKSPDTVALCRDLPQSRISKASRTGGLWEAEKPAALEAFPSTAALARRVEADHRRLTLVVVNTVVRALEVYDELGKLQQRKGSAIADTVLRLIHSRFRPVERDQWRDAFLNKAACQGEMNRIVVATQVIEAGVDISADWLVTELAPWSSLVQRFGRCARWGGRARVLVADFGLKGDKALPYNEVELDASRNALKQLVDVSPRSLESFEDALQEQLADAQRRLDEALGLASKIEMTDEVSKDIEKARQDIAMNPLPRLYPYDPDQLLLRHELDELFDTTPDLSGADIDISRFIRGGEERDLQVFWEDIVLDADGLPAATLQPSRQALCGVRCRDAQDWLCVSKSQKMKSGMRAWVWDWLEGRWRKVERRDLYPGQTVLVDADCGGYDPQRGWQPSAGKVAAVRATFVAMPEEQADAAQDDESLSASDWKTIATHGAEVGKEVGHITGRLAPALVYLCALAGRWHDVGKAHPAFQGSIKPPKPGGTLAKAPESTWLRGGSLYPMPEGGRRPGFRHELASALALFAVLQRHHPDHPALLGPWRELLQAAGQVSPPPSGVGERAPTPIEREILGLDADQFDLLAYLVCSHHGKVRLTWHACPADQESTGAPPRIRGIQDGDALPEMLLSDCDGQPQPLPASRLDLAPAAAGLNPHTGRGWTERILHLLQKYGPFTLAWLEALLRAADQRASRSRIADPLINNQNDDHGLERNYPTLAATLPGGAVAHSSGSDTPQSGAQHGLRGGAGGREDAGSRTQAPHHATRYLNTTLGILSYVELAPHLSLRVLAVEREIAEGRYASRPLDENLIREFHHRICIDLVPEMAGAWRQVDVRVSDHQAPSYPKVPMLMRNYCLDLQARVSTLQGGTDDLIPEMLAYAEGRLLWIHPFVDFNGRATRLLLTELLQRLGQPALNPTPDPGEETERYLQALTAADHADWQPLIQFWLARFAKEGEA